MERRPFLKLLGLGGAVAGVYLFNRNLLNLSADQAVDGSPTPWNPSATALPSKDIPSPITSPTAVASAEAALYKTEIRNFDEKWQSYIRADKTKVLLIPLANDFFYDGTRAVRTVELSGITIDCQKLWTLETPDRKHITLAELPHSTGDKVLPMAVLNDPSSVKSTESIISAYTYIGEEKVYHNKIYNMATALAHIMKYQEENGPFEKGKEYSYLKMIDLLGGEYKPGFNVYSYKVMGGGVCTAASVFCKALFLAGAEFTEKYVHSPREYVVWVGPGDPNVTAEGTDASVNYVSRNDVKDFRFVPSQTAYIDVDLSISPNGRKVNEFTLPGDARMVYTIKVTSTKPSFDKSEEILAARDAYDELPSGSTSPQNPPPESLNSQGKEKIIANLVYPEEKLSHFKKELEVDPDISEIGEIRDVLNSYVVATTEEKRKVGVGTYLRNSDWYKKFVNSGRSTRNLENILKILDQNTYRKEGQPFQCGAYTVLLASIGNKLSPKNIFGYTLSGGCFAENAYDMVPWVIKNNTTDFVDDQGFKFKVIKNISEVNVGNLFVRYDNLVGHIGAVVGKKNVDGETVLLVTDANRKPGKVFIFEVNANNFDAIFGGPPYNKVIIC
jgi:hypothetical protein